MSKERNDREIKMYQEWLKDKDIREALCQDENIANWIFDDINMKNMLLNNNKIREKLNKECVFIDTDNGHMLVHKSDLHLYTEHSIV